MSRFFSHRYDALEPYTPGEQPANLSELIKLNTNESPFPPTEKAVQYALTHTRPLNLYSDPLCAELTAAMARQLGIETSEVIFGNGSDEILNFAFQAFCDEEHPALFPNISYGFYPVFAALNRIPYCEAPIREDFTIDINDYIGAHKTIFIANPNAPTGLLLSLADIEKILSSNPDNVVVIDEAYIDFGGKSCVPLIHKYENLLVVQTFSKSRSMAGARLGFGIGNAKLIADLNTIKYSTNPYNVNSMTMAMGIGTLLDQETIDAQCKVIMENRAYTTKKLREMGCKVTDSYANFVFVSHPAIPGDALYQKLKEEKVLVRHFSKPLLNNWLRVTIGSKEQMEVFLAKMKGIVEAIG